MPIAALFEAFTCALRELDGIPLDRASCVVPLLHPEQRSTQLIWTRDGGIRALARGWSGTAPVTFERSPMRPLVTGEQVIIRHRISPDDGPRAYDVLDELAVDGFTDYFATVTRADKLWERATVSWATRTPGGFSDAHIEQLLAVMPLWSLQVTIAAQRASKRALLTTYLGEDAASRVLDGHVRRGESFDIEAAVCFCDLRDFTLLSQQLTQPELLNLLDDAFEAVVGAVEAERGEVLKFIGDAVLAVFRLEGGEEARRDAVARAFRAGHAVIQRTRAVDAERRAAGKAPLSVGLSLHLGRVAYGNIGGASRLDFTVIGAAVNLASRLEGMCRTLNAAMVVSDDVARRLDAEVLAAHRLEDTGEHQLKGIPGPVHVWAVRDA
ncbi:MAG: adenylate/guanylate cyclase domain-containing protein [Myxococcales bacterium]|nr:adenylate/guanylate cyclase domain-containing protein [Myxococcales bacterium]